MQERAYAADWNVPHPPVTSVESTWELLQSQLMVNWGWDLFIWDLQELLRLLTKTPAEFDYLFITNFLKARAAYLACHGPFACPQQMIVMGLGAVQVLTWPAVSMAMGPFETVGEVR